MVQARDIQYRDWGQKVNLPPNDKAEVLNGNERLLTVELASFRQEMDAAMSKFLEIEVEVGQTFAKAAANAQWTHELLHNRRLARRAYDTTTRLMTSAKLTEVNARKIARELQILRLMLSQLGDSL